MTTAHDEFYIFLTKYNFSYFEIIIILNAYLIYCGVRPGFFTDITITDKFYTFITYLQMWGLKYKYVDKTKKLFITNKNKIIPDESNLTAIEMGNFLGYLQSSNIKDIVNYNYTFSVCVSLFDDIEPDNNLIMDNIINGRNKLYGMVHTYYTLWNEVFDNISLNVFERLLMELNICLNKINSYGYIIIQSKRLNSSIVLSMNNIDLCYNYFNNFLLS